MSRIYKIRAREQAATQGPWATHRPNGEYVRNPETNFEVCMTRRSCDADFIAHAREDIPFLLDENDRKDEIIARLAAKNERAGAVHEELAREYLTDRDRWKAKVEALEAELTGYREAEQGGRLTIWPTIKKGKTVYWLWGGEVMPCTFIEWNPCRANDMTPSVCAKVKTKKERIFTDPKARLKISRERKIPAGDTRYLSVEGLGKWWFLARGAVEAALQRDNPEHAAAEWIQVAAMCYKAEQSKEMQV